MTQVYDASTGMADGGTFSSVQNPFHASHSGVLGQSKANTAYDFSWGNFGSFLVQATHQNQDTSGDFLRVLSDGLVHFSLAEDVSFNISASYTYNLPA